MEPGVIVEPMGVCVMTSPPAAKWAACWEDPHWRSTVVAGTDSGQPAPSTALRPMLRPWFPTWDTQPMITSATRAGSRSLRSTRAFSTSAARSAACQPESLPLRLPPAVRTASTMTAVGMGLAPRMRLDRTVKSGRGNGGTQPGQVHLNGASDEAGQGGPVVKITKEELDQAADGQTIPMRFLRTVTDHPDQIALRERTPDGEGWVELTYREYADRVAVAVTALESQGVGPGDRVVLMMRNCI